MANFKIGQKIVCIKSIELSEREIISGVNAPVINEIYTIRSFMFGRSRSGTETLAVTLEEIINPHLQYIQGYGEIHFAIRNFRPLDHAFSEEVIKMICEEPIEV